MTASPIRQDAPSAEAAIASDVSYEIIDTQVVPPFTRRVDVRLNKKVDADTLRAIALELKEQATNTFEQTFIGYYLPEMQVDAGYWATTHFTPDLEVRILGLSKKEESVLSQTSTGDPSRDVIGEWLFDEQWLLGPRVTFFRRDGQNVMERKYRDGSSSEHRLVVKQSREGREYMDAERAGPDDDYYMIDKTGRLQIWSMDVDGTHGLLYTSRRAIVGHLQLWDGLQARFADGWSDELRTDLKEFAETFNQTREGALASDELKAAGSLALAKKQYIETKQYDFAKGALERLLKAYPDTIAANEAQDLLSALPNAR